MPARGPQAYDQSELAYHHGEDLFTEINIWLIFCASYLTELHMTVQKLNNMAADSREGGGETNYWSGDLYFTNQDYDPFNYAPEDDVVDRRYGWYHQMTEIQQLGHDELKDLFMQLLKMRAMLDRLRTIFIRRNHDIVEQFFYFFGLPQGSKLYTYADL